MDSSRTNGLARCSRACSTWAVLAIVGSLYVPPASGQSVAERDAPRDAASSDVGVIVEGSKAGQSPRLVGKALQLHLQTQLARLDDPDFRTRQLAQWRIEQHPLAAMSEIKRIAPRASINSATQMIDLLDRFSAHPDSSISSGAYDLLKVFSASQGTALASLASKSIAAIEGMNELKAFEILTHAGANIGFLNLSINGSQSEMFAGNLMSIEIKTSNFSGDADALAWIRYLKSVEVVSLEGPIITQELLALVAQMPNARKILLRNADISPEDLLVLKELPDIQHLEMNYMPVTDVFIPVLCQLPLSQSLRLFGTDVTAAGTAELAQRLDGLEIYRGEGGFLGISSPATGEVIVNRVVANSAAAKAGVQLNDVITEIHGVPIKNFTELRENLAKYAPTEIIRIKVQRPVTDPINRKRVRAEIELTVVLGELENQ